MDVSGSSHYVHGNRPASISELATRAQDIFWDPNKGLKHWLRTAEKARRTAEQLVKDGDYENAFVNYAKAATVVLEKIPTHRDYSVLLTPDQRKNLDMVVL
ncbi:uncharacterized protein LAESUDRAFT_529647 [Laetiporus sulphureus 93-53]|uniref:USP8 dimerisation domain-containing protein n=1 Tax=Laetiporus sulphureus 93-53 TaxID=1314785 RepID=A0A165BC34_9APHY|nr:uncharacterized protein LAESUDRAFT_529647 [Laetiporus sulphureus 93-53]KZT00710.1 hypothetical protein LAESUDRAFT_529647 [Laetiporus sulphureus 93-53]